MNAGETELLRRHGRLHKISSASQPVLLALDAHDIVLAEIVAGPDFGKLRIDLAGPLETVPSARNIQICAFSCKILTLFCRHTRRAARYHSGLRAAVV